MPNPRFAAWIGDFRPSDIFVYHLKGDIPPMSKTGYLEEKTPNDPLINWTLGIRAAGSTGKVVFLGMANPMNLLTDPNDDVPEGGWELLKLRAEDEDDED